MLCTLCSVCSPKAALHDIICQHPKSKTKLNWLGPEIFPKADSRLCIMWFLYNSKTWCIINVDRESNWMWNSHRIQPETARSKHLHNPQLHSRAYVALHTALITAFCTSDVGLTALCLRLHLLFRGEPSFGATHLLVLVIHPCSDWLQLSVARQTMQLRENPGRYFDAIALRTRLSVERTRGFSNTQFGREEGRPSHSWAWPILYTDPTQQVVWHSSLLGRAIPNTLRVLAQFCFGICHFIWMQLE